jgi:hypothetical protein
MSDFSSGGDRHTPEDEVTKPFVPAKPANLDKVIPYNPEVHKGDAPKPTMTERVNEALTRAAESGTLVSALDQQVGGSHYKNMVIQPVTYMMANGLGFMEGSVIKYVSRWRDKGGLEDLKKARHFLDLLIEHEEQ